MKNLKCNCEGWEKGANQIISAQITLAQRGLEYTGDIFKYCPWCGKVISPNKPVEPTVTAGADVPKFGDFAFKEDYINYIIEFYATDY